jgi:chromosome segregation ATPase
MESKKRPANSMSRGNSPPEKRSRSFMLADRPVVSRRATDPRPQLDLSRASTDQLGQHSPLRTGSASNQGRGASTPTQIAPTAPSMLPAIFQESRAPEHVNDTAVPASLASLHVLRMKKKAMAKTYPPQAAEASATVSVTALQAQLKAAQMEISALRRQMKNLENLPNQVSSLTAKLEKGDTIVDDSASLQAVLHRLEALEKSKSNPSLSSALENPKAAVQTHHLDEVTELKFSVSSHQKQLEKVQTWIDKRGPVLDIVPSLKKDIEDVKSQVKSTPEIRQVEHLIDNAKRSLRAEADETSARITETVERNHKAVQELVPKVSACLDLKKDLEEQNLPLQLQTLHKGITGIEKDQAKYKDLQHSLSQLRLAFDKHKNDIDRDLTYHVEKQDDAKKEMDKQMSILKNKINECPTTSSLQHQQSDQAQENRRLAVQQKKTETALKELSDAHEYLREEHKKLADRPVEVYDDRLDKLDREVESLQQLLESNSKPAFALELRDRLSVHERVASEGLQALRADLEQLGIKQTSFKTELKDAQNDINAAADAIGSLDKEVHDQGLAVESLRSGISTLIANLFKEQLDPFQDNIDQTVSSVKGDLKSLTDEVAMLKHQVERSRTQTPQSSFTGSQSAHFAMLEATSTYLKAQMSRLQDQLEAEISERNNEVSKLWTQTLQNQNHAVSPKSTALQSSTLQALVQEASSLRQDVDQLRGIQTTDKDRQDHEMHIFREQLAAKQDTIAAGHAMDVIKLGVRNLQDQYNNITTESLHQHMVHWFLEQYPSNSAELLQRTKSMERELSQLQNYWQQVSWIQSHAEALRTLAQNGPSTNPSIPNSDLQRISTTANEALDAARMARAKCDAADKRVTEYKADIQSLRTQLTNLVDEERSTRAEFVTKAGAEHQQRVTAENRMRLAIHQLKEEMEKETNSVAASIGTTIARLERVETASTRLRGEYNTIISILIEPNADLLGQLREAFIAVAELQQVTLQLNEKLLRDKLQISWTHELNPPSGTDT